MTTFRRTTASSLALICLFAAFAEAAPVLSLTLPGGAGNSTSIIAGTQSVTLGLSVNTDSNAVGELLYYITTSPANAVNYASTNAVTALNAPFTSVDLNNGFAPTAGATVKSGKAGSTQWTKLTDGDYAAFSGEIARYTFNTSALAASSVAYVFTPVGMELGNAVNVNSVNGPITTFAPPGSFSLTVTPAPEPTMAVAIVGMGFIALKRKRESVGLQ